MTAFRGQTTFQCRQSLAKEVESRSRDDAFAVVEG
jgi:hypothetical protein